MSKHQPQENGPTWGDVQDYVEHLKGRFSVQATLVVRFYPAGKSGARCASVVAEGRVSQAANAEVRAVGFYQFRGGSGAATMPGAMWHALSALEGKLEGIETVAQARLPF